MAIYTDRLLMDVYRMIKKGSVQFEPGDRIPITFANQGKEFTKYLGSVYYDDTSHNVCYDLFNHADSADPIGTLQPRDVKMLSAGDLLSVANRLEEYERYSVLRYDNYKGIEETLQKTEGNRMEFEGVSRPRVLVNSALRSADIYAGFLECRVDSVFLAKGDCYASVSNGNGEQMNVKLAMFNDRSIMNVSACMKSSLHEQMTLAQPMPAKLGLPF